MAKILSLVLITTLLATVKATPEPNVVYERQSSSFCNNGLGLPNGALYCAPAANTTFDISQTIKFAWNTEDGEIKTKGFVDVYLYRNDDLALVFSQNNVNNQMQVLPVKVSSSWFAGPSPQQKSVGFFFKVTSFGASVFSVPSGPVFFITQPAQVATSAATTAIASTTTLANFATSPVITEASNDKDQTFSPPLIAIICIAGIAALVAIIALAMATKNRKQGKNRFLSNISASSTVPITQYKDSRDLESPVDVASITSVTPLSKKESQPNIAQAIQRVSLSSPSRSSLAGVPNVTFSSVSSAGALSVSEAAFLSDAFRHTLRKPEWKTEEDEHDDDDDDHDDDGEELSEEEKKLRREAKELMKKELAEEGTGLQSVSRKQARIETMPEKDLQVEEADNE